jgi:hypothetical protein
MLFLKTLDVIQQHLLDHLVASIQESSFWFGFFLTFTCIFALGPLSTERIEFMKEWDDLLL